MNPGPVEEAGRVASGVVETFQSAPLILALILLQAAVLVMVMWIARENQITERAVFDALIQHCKLQ